MNDCISRQELIDALEADYNRPWLSPQGSEEYIEGVRDEYDDVLKIVSGMKPVQPTNRWISADEALPVYDGLVLTVDKNNTIRLGMYTELGWTSQSGNPMMSHITDWQSLPEPPKE